MLPAAPRLCPQTLLHSQLLPERLLGGGNNPQWVELNCSGCGRCQPPPHTLVRLWFGGMVPDLKLNTFLDDGGDEGRVLSEESPTSRLATPGAPGCQPSANSSRRSCTVWIHDRFCLVQGLSSLTLLGRSQQRSLNRQGEREELLEL